MNRLLQRYFSVSLVIRILVSFVAGAIIGGILWLASAQTGKPIAESVTTYISPFGAVFVSMLKMIVIPVIFFSLVVGAASLPVNRFGRVGVKVIGWYFLSSLLAAAAGVLLALVISPGSGAGLDGWQAMASTVGGEAEAIASRADTEGAFTKLLVSMFRNPFDALANGQFLGIIVFAILFGLATRISIEASEDTQTKLRLEMLIDLFTAARDAMFKLVDWILEYAPIGVLCLTIVNFGLYGPKIVGPYVSVTLGVAGGILIMIFVVYSALLVLVTKENPLRVFKRIEEAMLTAFVTRSSAATLPVSIKTATEELKIRGELASFSLPLGATINMDGVCVHLPMFAVLAANMFDLKLTAAGLVILVVTTVLASVGAGGVPGGSLMLLFIILEAMGLTGQQVAVIVALALGINPILDMFETMNNITGDLVCTYAVAKNEGLLDEDAVQ